MTLTAFLRVSTSKSVPNDLTEYPIALSTFLSQPAATASLSKSQTALAHPSTGEFISSSLFRRPITNARNRRCRRRRDTVRFFPLPRSHLFPVSSHDTIEACGSTSNCTVYTCGIISLRHSQHHILLITSKSCTYLLQHARDDHRRPVWW